MVTKERVIEVLQQQTQPVSFAKLFHLLTGHTSYTGKYNYHYINLNKTVRRFAAEDERIVIRPRNKFGGGAHISLRSTTQPHTRVTPRVAPQPREWSQIVAAYVDQVDAEPRTKEAYTLRLNRAYDAMFGRVLPANLTLRTVHDALSTGRQYRIPTKRGRTRRFYSRTTIYSILLRLADCSEYARKNGWMFVSFEESVEFNKALSAALEVTYARRGLQVRHKPSTAPTQDKKPTLWESVKRFFTGG